MLYLDTSLLVTAHAPERRTAEIQLWLGKQASGTLAISDWVVTEFSAALSIKRRNRHIDAALQADALAAFANLVADSFIVFNVRASHFHSGARLADRHSLGLRAGDALHLAIAFDYGATLCTLDERLAKAGSPVGVQTRLL